MSFILEALKKSDRERHQQKATQKNVRQRTLVVATNRASRRWSPWLLPLILILLIGSGWWIMSTSDVSPEVAAENPASTQPAAIEQPPPARPQDVVEPVALQAAEAPVKIVEPAPLPRQFAETSPANQTASQNSRSAEKGTLQPGSSSDIQAEGEQPIEMIMVSTVEPQKVEDVPQAKTPGYPLYEDLPRELRSRIPKLELSMHFFTESPQRRLVRLNNRLMHEEDWIDKNTQVIEILSTGVLLDYQGKEFELRNLRE